MGRRATQLALVVVAVAAGAARCRPGAAGTVAADELRATAIAAYRSGDVIAAVAQLRRLIAVYPNDSLAYAYLADACRRGGWTAEGYRVFRAAASARPPGRPELRYYLAFFAAYQGQPDSAERWAAAARGVRPPTYAEAVTLSDVLLLDRRFDAALTLLDEAARRFPQRPEARVRLATLLARLGRSADARRETARLLRDFPRDRSALATAAQLDVILGDLGGAAAHTDRWLSIAPQDAEARWNVVRIALRRDEWARADSALSNVVATGH